MYENMKDEELLALYKQKYPQGVDPQKLAMLKSGQAQPPQPQGPDITSLLAQAQGKPSMGNRVQSGVHNALSAGAQMWGGVKPETSSQDNLLSKYLETIVGEQAKSLYKTPDYVVSYDQEGKPVFTPAPGHIKNQPFYATPQGGQYYQARTGQAEAQGKQAQVETGLMEQVMPAVKDAMAGNNGQLPPGASISAGPVTFQPNPRLTDTEQAAVAGSEAIEPVVARILQTVQSGIYGKGGNIPSNIERTARQGIVDSGNAILSSQDSNLQSFQSDVNNLKRLIPFTDGGKQLTPFEAKRVFALLNTAGKSDEQIGTDIQAAVSIVMAKGGLAIGGRNAALNGGLAQPQQQPTGGIDLSKMSPEELQKIINS